MYIFIFLYIYIIIYLIIYLINYLFIDGILDNKIESANVSEARGSSALLFERGGAEGAWRLEF